MKPPESPGERRLELQSMPSVAYPAPAAGESRSWSRLDGVDILRGLAIFLVLMNHINMRLFLAHIPYTQGLPRQLVSSLVWNGQQGVQIFFAVSGFLITSTSIRRWGALSRIAVRDFYALRCARIAPLLVLLLTVLCALHAVGLKDYTVSAATGGLGRALLAALTFHVNVLEAQRGYLPGSWDILWSLSVEEIFYLFFPLLCWLLGGGWWLTAVLLAFVVTGPFARTVLSGGNEVWHEYSYLGGMDAIALGCLTAILLARVRVPAHAGRVLGTLGVALLVFTLGFSRTARAWGLEGSGVDMTLTALASCLVIVAAVQSQWSAPRPLAPLTRLGQRSYEVYLTHMFVVFGAYGLFKTAGSSLASVPALFIGTLVLAALLGTGAGRLFSEPLNQLIRRRLGDGPERLGSVLRAEAETPAGA